MLCIDIKKIFIKNLAWIIFFACILCFLVLTKDVLLHKVIRVDEVGYSFIAKYLISDTLTTVMKCITCFGGAGVLLLITLLLFVFIKNKKLDVCIGVNLIIITIFNQVFKAIVQRPRPIENRIISETGYSFPSGHSMVSMAFYGYLIYLIYKYIKNKYLKWTLIVIFSILILLIGLSRIYLGVHYISDVIGGFVFSIAYLIIFISITFKWCGVGK